MKAKEIRKAEQLSVAQQNYLEAIDELVSDHGHAHPSEIARALKIRKPSVTEAVDRLVELGIVRRREQVVVLTKRGARIANELSNRHDTLRSFMVEVLGMEHESADVAACRIEHSASPKFIKRLRCLQEFIATKGSSSLKSEWMKTLENIS